MGKCDSTLRAQQPQVSNSGPFDQKTDTVPLSYIPALSATTTMLLPRSSPDFVCRYSPATAAFMHCSYNVHERFVSKSTH